MDLKAPATEAAVRRENKHRRYMLVRGSPIEGFVSGVLLNVEPNIIGSGTALLCVTIEYSWYKGRSGGLAGWSYKGQLPQ